MKYSIMYHLSLAYHRLTKRINFLFYWTVSSKMTPGSTMITWAWTESEVSGPIHYLWWLLVVYPVYDDPSYHASCSQHFHLYVCWPSALPSSQPSPIYLSQPPVGAHHCVGQQSKLSATLIMLLSLLNYLFTFIQSLLCHAFLSIFWPSFFISLKHSSAFFAQEIESTTAELKLNWISFPF